MSEQIKDQVRRSRKKAGLAEETTVTQSESAEAAREHLSEIDDLMEEIDALLEDNAEEFVRSYVQKGGQ